MSEITSLSATMEKAILDYFAANGGGFPMGFVCIVDFASEDGESKLLIAKQSGQPTHRSMGLASYLDLWFKDDAQLNWSRSAAYYHIEDDDEDE